MLKTFMQPGQSATSRADANRPARAAAYAPGPTIPLTAAIVTNPGGENAVSPLGGAPA